MIYLSKNPHILRVIITFLRVFFMALEFLWPLFTFIIVIFFPELQCEQPEAPSNSDQYTCYVSLGYCTYSCKANKMKFKNNFFILCNSTTLQWDEDVDCVGKQKLLLLFLLFWVVSTFFFFPLGRGMGNGRPWKDPIWGLKIRMPRRCFISAYFHRFKNHWQDLARNGTLDSCRKLA